MFAERKEKYEKQNASEENLNKTTSMCSTCVLKENCAISHQGSNFYGCEEYEQAEIKEVTIDCREEMKPLENLGLCATCNEKKRCRHNSMPGGVWHCEEYR